MILEAPAYMITSKSIFLFRHTIFLDFPHWDLLIPWRKSYTPIVLQYERTSESRDLLWLNGVSWIILLLWCLIWRCLYWGISYSTMIGSLRWQFIPNTYFLKIILYWGLTHFERMYSYWGIATLLIFDIETWPSAYDCYLRWIIELLTP